MPLVTCPHCGARNRVEERGPSAQPVCGRCRTPLMAAGATAPIDVTDASLPRVLAEAGATPVLVDCWASWCPPCRALAPILDQLAAESAGRYIIAKLNADEHPQTPARYGVQGLPTS
jgi:thioredoxin 2